jgi:quercetin dioxygenase-like cupin family protein
MADFFWLISLRSTSAANLSVSQPLAKVNPRPSLLAQEKTMQVKPSVFGSATVALALSFAAAALAQSHDPVALTAEKMKWSSQGGLALPGLEQVSLVGDPSKPGPYTIRLKFPAGYKLAPHTHPDSREVTILSGTWYTGYGEQADPGLLKALPAGSFYTEPANLPHFVEVHDPVVIQVSGVGPSGRAFVGARK